MDAEKNSLATDKQTKQSPLFQLRANLRSVLAALTHSPAITTGTSYIIVLKVKFAKVEVSHQATELI